MIKLQKIHSLWRTCIVLMLAAAMLLSGMEPMQTYAAQPGRQKTESTDLKVKHATVWPVQDVVMYDNKGNEITTIKAGTPLLAVNQSQGYLKVYYHKKLGLVDSNLCMINLPDVMQDEMLYDITNSYSSIYKIHGESIDGVTDEILYPYVKTGKDTYLVPLLYPVAVKLYEAEADAIKRGYTIKVYDAYRPYTVTQEIYARTSEFIEENPEYGEMMTESVNGETYNQSNFLAKSVSNHNYGVAVDITLADLSTGEELSMQAPMHELSTRSILSLNNEEADLLSDIMLSHGFTGLLSEWWHFQIRDCRTQYAAFQAKPLEN